MLLDIDKNMIGQYIKIENIAYYSVAIFIATVISVPSRAMHQITYPITAKLMSENKHEELNELYKKSSITLQVIGGLILVGILVNINELYSVLPVGYSEGIAVVFFIGISKYFDLVLGNNNAIIFNSKYYRAVLFLGLLLGYGLVSFIDTIPFRTDSLPTVKTYPVNLDPMFFVIGFSFAIVSTFLAGYFPAKKAKKIDPVTIIRGQ